MSMKVSPPRWKILLNGYTFRRGFTTRLEADAFAERWQGSHSGNSGLLKHKDRGDYVEVVRDYEMEQEIDERIDEAQRGNPQRMIVEYDPTTAQF